MNREYWNPAAVKRDKDLTLKEYKQKVEPDNRDNRGKNNNIQASISGSQDWNCHHF